MSILELVLKGVDDRARQRRRRTARNHHLGAHHHGQRTSGRHGRQPAQQSNRIFVPFALIYTKKLELAGTVPAKFTAVQRECSIL